MSLNKRITIKEDRWSTCRYQVSIQQNSRRAQRYLSIPNLLHVYWLHVARKAEVGDGIRCTRKWVRRQILMSLAGLIFSAGVAIGFAVQGEKTFGRSRGWQSMEFVKHPSTPLKAVFTQSTAAHLLTRLKLEVLNKFCPARQWEDEFRS